MAKTGLSNRARKGIQKRAAKAPRTPTAPLAEIVAAQVAKPARAEPAVRDGLDWLRKKKRISSAQQSVGIYYRERFIQAGEEGAGIKSSLNIAEGSGIYNNGKGGGLPNGGGTFALSAAKRELFVLRFHVLRGQSDLLTVMDGVCGMKRTVRFLAGDDRHRADELEVALRIALDLLAAYLKAHADAARNDSATKAA